MKLNLEDVWGVHDEETFELIKPGLIVARGLPDLDEYFSQEEYDRITAKRPAICPIWNEKLEYKSVTAVCSPEQLGDVLYWLSYVHGGEYSKMKKLKDGRIAIRSDYQCW